MSDKTYRWGIMGMGRMARKFAEDLRLLPQARLHAVASTDLNRAATFAADFGVPHFFGNYEALLQHCPDLDVVYIATPHTAHCPLTLMCLARRVPVLVEKPFAMHRREAQLMVQTARKNRTFLMEALWTLFIPAVQTALRWVHSGELGRVHTVRADLGFHGPFDPNWRIYNKELGGGATLDVGIYPVLLAQSIFGLPDFSRLKAAATFAPTGVDQTCGMIFRYPDARWLSLLHCSIVTNTSRQAEIWCERGTITLHKAWHCARKLTRSTFDDAHRTETFEDFDLPFEGHGYHFEAAHVMDCLSQQLTQSPIVPLQFSINLMATLDAVRRKIGMYYPSDSAK